MTMARQVQHNINKLQIQLFQAGRYLSYTTRHLTRGSYYTNKTNIFHTPIRNWKYCITYYFILISPFFENEVSRVPQLKIKRDRTYDIGTCVPHKYNKVGSKNKLAIGFFRCIPWIILLSINTYYWK